MLKGVEDCRSDQQGRQHIGTVDANQHSPEPNVFRPEETVELVFEGVTIQDFGYIWNVAQTKEQPSATYVARMVEIESGVSVDDAGLVQTRALEYAQAGSP